MRRLEQARAMLATRFDAYPPAVCPVAVMMPSRRMAGGRQESAVTRSLRRFSR